jgi:hypothetical protein
VTGLISAREGWRVGRTWPGELRWTTPARLTDTVAPDPLVA